MAALAAANTTPIYGLSTALAAGGSMIFGADKRVQTGNINYNMVFQNMSKLLTPPRSRELLAEVDAGMRNMDYTDLVAEYAGRTVPLAGEAMMAAMHNNQNLFLIQSISPLMYTPEQNFFIQRFEIIQIPYDKLGPGSIARTTGYRQSQSAQSLAPYKRAGRIEFNLLMDPNFGEMRLNQIKGSLYTQATLTVMNQIQGALVDIPYRQEMKRLSMPNIPFNHTRKRYERNAQFGLGHTAPERLLAEVLRMAADGSDPDVLLCPKGKGYLISRVYADLRQQPMPVYMVQFDDAVGDFLVQTYEKGGRNSITTLAKGNGKSLFVSECVGYKMDIDDAEEEDMQAFRSVATLAEVVLMAKRQRDQPFAGQKRELNVQCADHKPGQLEITEIHYTDALASSSLFVDYDGTLHDGSPTAAPLGASNVVADLIMDMNNNDLEKAHNYFRNPAYHKADANNRVPVKYLNSSVSLKDMDEFREFFGFVTYNDARNRFEFPALVGDIEPRTEPTEHLLDVTRCLLKKAGSDIAGFVKGLFNLDTNSTAPDVPAVAAVAPNPAAPAYYTIGNQYVPVVLRGQVIVDSGESGAFDIQKVAIIVTHHDFNAAPFVLIPNNAANVIAARNPAKQASKAARKTREKAEAKTRRDDALKKVSFRVATVLLAARPGEERESFLGRVNAPNIQQAVRDEDLGEDTIWTEILKLTPDSALEDFAVVSHAAQTQSTVSEDVVLSKLQNLHAQLTEFQDRAHTAEILKKAATLLRDDSKTFANLPAGRYLNAREERRLNDGAEEPTFETAEYVINGSSMDLGDDAPPPSIGAFQVPALGADTHYNAGVHGASTSFSFSHHWEKLHGLTSDPLERVMFYYLMHAPFNYTTCYALAQQGCELVRFNYFKLFATFIMSSMVLLKAGPQTLFTAMNQPHVTIGFDADEGYLSLTSQFRMGVISVRPENIKLLPFAVFDTFVGGRNNSLLKSLNEFMSNAPDKPAIYVSPVPPNEVDYETPMNLFNEPNFFAPDSSKTRGLSKHSGYPLLRQFVGEDTLDQFSLYTAESSFWAATQMAVSAERACAWYPKFGSNDVKWEVLEGTGSLGEVHRNLPSSAKVYMGQGSFLTNYDTSIGVR